MDPRDLALRRERTRQRRRHVEHQRRTAARVVRLLRAARERIAARLAANASDFDRATLPRLQAEVEAALATFAARAGEVVEDAAATAWQQGIDQIDKPIEAGFAAAPDAAPDAAPNADDPPRVVLDAVLPRLDTRQLDQIATFMTDRMKDISATLGARVDEQLGLVATGAQGVSEAAREIERAFESGGVAGGRGRVNTIVRTELGRAFSAAGDQRLRAAKARLPGLKKQWRRSGKVFSRTNHDLTDGQVREVADMFNVGGVTLEYPRDPRGPASETVNCRCTSLPIMDRWVMHRPGAQPFSRAEIARNPRKRDIEAARDGGDIPVPSQDPTFAAWLDGQAGPRRRRIARLPQDLAEAIDARVTSVELSRQTAIKQTREHPELDPEAYDLVAPLLATGDVWRVDDKTLLAIGDLEGKLWQGVVKAQGEGGELFLKTFHRTNPKKRRKVNERRPLVRGSREAG